MAPPSKSNFAYNQTVGTEGAPAGHILEVFRTVFQLPSCVGRSCICSAPFLLSPASFLLMSPISCPLVSWTHWGFLEYLRLPLGIIHALSFGWKESSTLQALHQLHLKFLPFRAKFKQWFLRDLSGSLPLSQTSFPLCCLQQQLYWTCWFPCPYLCGPRASRGESLYVEDLILLSPRLSRTNIYLLNTRVNDQTGPQDGHLAQCIWDCIPGSRET